LGEDTKPWERSDLGGVGEGLCAVGRTEPLTQLRLGSKLPSLRNPLPKERGSCPIRRAQYRPDAGRRHVAANANAEEDWPLAYPAFDIGGGSGVGAVTDGVFAIVDNVEWAAECVLERVGEA
jgi:hypothetical protein